MNENQMDRDFRIWVARMGYGERQNRQAAALIGLTGKTTTSAICNGKRELTMVERLAMSAVRAGLRPWTPEYDDELQEASLAPREATAA